MKGFTFPTHDSRTAYWLRDDGSEGYFGFNEWDALDQVGLLMRKMSTLRPFVRAPFTHYHITHGGQFTIAFAYIPSSHGTRCTCAPWGTSVARKHDDCSTIWRPESQQNTLCVRDGAAQVRGTAIECGRTPHHAPKHAQDGNHPQHERTRCCPPHRCMWPLFLLI